MRILFDTDVVLDAPLQRTPFNTDADLLWQACITGKIDGFVSGVTPLMFSISLASKLEQNKLVYW